MKIEKVERVVIAVKNLDKAESFFSDLFGIKFLRTAEKVARGEIKRTRKVTEHADLSLGALQRNPAFSSDGIELLETIPPVEKEGISSIALKVSDLQKAKAEMKKKGVRLIEELEFGGVKEAIYRADDFFGVRLVLIEYKAPDLVSAILSKK
jgi:catechol 2,3-dioxygenase-like lactoylglutathione lyase family enzyme